MHLLYGDRDRYNKLFEGGDGRKRDIKIKFKKKNSKLVYKVKILTEEEIVKDLLRHIYKNIHIDKWKL